MAKKLLDFMDSNEIFKFNTTIGIMFLQNHYSVKTYEEACYENQSRLWELRMLSEFQLHGTYMQRKPSREYDIPENFYAATDAFLAHRRFKGIIERNITTIYLYLERFFSYLS